MDSVKKEATGIVKRSVDLAQDSVLSLGWWYPLKGIPYFWAHEQLRNPLLKLIIPALAISAAVVAGLFATVYLPQAAVLSIVQLGPLGFVTAVGVTLAEAGFVINIILKSFLLSDTLTETFDQVLLLNGLDDLVSKGRTVSAGSSGSGSKGKTLGKMLMKPLDKFRPEAIARQLLTLPLNMIPLVGTPIFFFLNGTKAGPGAMGRYFQLKGLSGQQREQNVHAHRGAYTALGVTSLLLTLLPVVGPVVFTYSNVVGAALLAVDLEKKQGDVARGESDIKGGRKKEL